MSALLLTKSQASEYQDQSADARATTESQPTDGSRMHPVNKEYFDVIEQVHNSWNRHLRIDATIAMLETKMCFEKHDDAFGTVPQSTTSDY